MNVERDAVQSIAKMSLWGEKERLGREKYKQHSQGGFLCRKGKE